MFDASLPEFVLVLIIGLLILGPERLPRVATKIGRWVGKARRTASQLRHQLEREIAMSDIGQPPKRPKPPPKPAAPPQRDDPAAGGADPDATESTSAEAGGEAPAAEPEAPAAEPEAPADKKSTNDSSAV